jgi:hypothetical protein
MSKGDKYDEEDVEDYVMKKNGRIFLVDPGTMAPDWSDGLIEVKGKKKEKILALFRHPDKEINSNEEESSAAESSDGESDEESSSGVNAEEQSSDGVSRTSSAAPAKKEAAAKQLRKKLKTAGYIYLFGKGPSKGFRVEFDIVPSRKDRRYACLFVRNNGKRVLQLTFDPADLERMGKRFLNLLK